MSGSALGQRKEPFEFHINLEKRKLLGSGLGNNNNIDGWKETMLAFTKKFAQQPFHTIPVHRLAEATRGRYAETGPLGAARCGDD